MNILMILDREFPPDIRVENEIETLSEAGHEIHLACFTRENRPEYELAENCHIHRRSISKLLYKSSVAALTFPLYFRFWERYITRLIQEFSFHAIHVHDLPLVKVGAEISRKYNIPLTADLHENWPAYLRISKHTKTPLGRLLSPNRKWIKYEQKILHQTDQIIVVVDEARSRLTKLGLDPARVHVVSNTLNLKHFSLSETPATDSDTILFYAGGLTYHRGIQVVLQALAMVKDTNPELKCWILGEGSYKTRLQQISSELDLEDRVIFHGWKPYGEMIQMLARSDYALIPHLKSDHTDSTIPHKLFQYMYARKPVISSNCIPIERIISSTNSGYIYPSGRSEDLASIFQNLSEEFKEKLGINGARWVQQKYNWARDSTVLLEIYS
jgi:glycosyltransferase involved in cell wall biosynthesis